MGDQGGSGRGQPGHRSRRSDRHAGGRIHGRRPQRQVVQGDVDRRSHARPWQDGPLLSHRRLDGSGPSAHGELSAARSRHAASAAMCAFTILSGFFTGSPRLILSTFSMPSVTLPQTVYWPLRKDASSKQMKNWLSPEAVLAARAISLVTSICLSFINTSFRFL